MDILQQISTVSGYLSIGCWLFAQLPQCIENYMNHSVSGISLGFLSCWILGDITNLIGCLLTGALPFQTLLAGYYCFIDVILSTQYYYYTYTYPAKQERLNRIRNSQKLQNYHETTTSPTLGNTLPIEHINIPKNPYNGFQPSSFLPKVVSASFMASFTKVQSYPLYNSDKVADLAVSPMNLEQIGKVFAWTCTILYLSSRMPQLIKNYQRGTTKGISIYLFIAALNGNIFYTTSLLSSLKIMGWPREYLINELPYIIGSAGTIMFDLVMLYQWYIFDDCGRKLKHHHHNHNHHRHGHSHSQQMGMNNSYRSSSGERLLRDEIHNPYPNPNPIIIHNPTHLRRGSVVGVPIKQTLETTLHHISNSFKSMTTSPSKDIPSTSYIPKIINITNKQNKKKMAHVPLSPMDFLSDGELFEAESLRDRGLRESFNREKDREMDGLLEQDSFNYGSF